MSLPVLFITGTKKSNTILTLISLYSLVNTCLLILKWDTTHRLSSVHTQLIFEGGRVKTVEVRSHECGLPKTSRLLSRVFSQTSPVVPSLRREVSTRSTFLFSPFWRGRLLDNWHKVGIKDDLYGWSFRSFTLPPSPVSPSSVCDVIVHHPTSLRKEPLCMCSCDRFLLGTMDTQFRDTQSGTSMRGLEMSIPFVLPGLVLSVSVLAPRSVGHTFTVDTSHNRLSRLTIVDVWNTFPSKSDDSLP